MFLALLVIFGSLLIIAGIGAFILLQSGDLIAFVFITGISALLIIFLTSLYFRDKYILARKIQKVCEALFSIAGINFVTFISIHIIIGGSAPNGKVVNGHYFVGDHGHYNEVPYVIYVYSLIHAYSLFITHPLAIIAGYVYGMTGGKKQIKIKPDILKLLPKKKALIHGETQHPESKS